MSKMKTCDGCEWFEASGEKAPPGFRFAGTCFLNPPTTIEERERRPAVFPKDRCSHFEPKDKGNGNV
jgi:hypothetical protein